MHHFFKDFNLFFTVCSLCFILHFTHLAADLYAVLHDASCVFNASYHACLQPKGKDEDKKQDGEKMGSGRAIPIKQVSY